MSLSTALTGLTVHLPAPKQLRDLLADLLGRDVSLRPSPPFAVSPMYPASIGTFVDDQLRIRAAIAYDVPLSAYVGAALALVPASGAETAIADAELGETISEGLSEVFNVMASMFNIEGSEHLRLYQAHLTGQQLPHDARARTQVLGRREDFAVEVAGYGTGRVAIVLT
ncbi:MAG: hypothetical protein CMH83_06365 [Nocardioides sp.]|nr:hypothetical protein [Nocardioides sp.]